MNFRVFERPAGRTALVTLDWVEFLQLELVYVNDYFDVNRSLLFLSCSGQIAFFCEHVVFAVTGVM